MSEDNQYLGGPASFCNWAPTSSSTMIVRQISHGSGRHHVRAETKGALKGGTELLWDYGKKNMPTFYNENWFKPEVNTCLHTSFCYWMCTKKAKCSILFVSVLQTSSDSQRKVSKET